MKTALLTNMRSNLLLSHTVGTRTKAIERGTPNTASPERSARLSSPDEKDEPHRAECSFDRFGEPIPCVKEALVERGRILLVSHDHRGSDLVAPDKVQGIAGRAVHACTGDRRS